VRLGKIKVSGTINAYDINEPLIYVYKNIQQRHNELYAILQSIIGELNACPNEGTLNRKPTTVEEATMSKENYYYWCRARYNGLSAEEKRTPLGSVLFIFLNKTCFRGVFRLGPNGFNVPYGHYKNPEIINKEHLDEVHRLIQNVRFECMDFASSISQVVTGDYVYLDPPYAPETATSFVGYTENGFGIDKHNELFALIRKKNMKFMMSNADVEMVRANFPDGVYTTDTVLCKRSINSKKPESKTNEVIIKNY
jgi:DNA adenine methylase